MRVCSVVCVCGVRVCVCVYVCDLQNSVLRLVRSDLGCCATGYVCIVHNSWKTNFMKCSLFLNSKIISDECNV